MAARVRRLRSVCIVLLLTLAPVVVPTPATAANPGGNGPIVFAREGDLWRVDHVTAQATRITDTPEIVESAPAVSPDGTRIAYQRPSEGTMDLNDAIWVIGVDGSGAVDEDVQPRL